MQGSDMRVMVTGHRAYETTEQSGFAQSELKRIAVKLADEYAAKVAISGMALGADLWWADSALLAGMDLWGYIPFEGQDASWALPDQSRYSQLRSRCAKEVVLGPSYDVKLLFARNDAMLRDSNTVIAVVDPKRTKGGTVYTVRKAKALGKALITVDVAALRTTSYLGQE